LPNARPLFGRRRRLRPNQHRPRRPSGARGKPAPQNGHDGDVATATVY